MKTTARSEAVSVYKGADPARKMDILVYALCAV